MSNVQVLDVMYQALQLMMRLSLPFLIISMAVGVLVAIFQAATQINEQTITFVPKLLAILGLLGALRLRQAWQTHIAQAVNFLQLVFCKLKLFCKIYNAHLT